MSERAKEKRGKGWMETVRTNSNQMYILNEYEEKNCEGERAIEKLKNRKQKLKINFESMSMNK